MERKAHGRRRLAAIAQAREPIGFKQLCVIARATLTEDLTQDNSTWSEAIKCRLLALGFDYPTDQDGMHKAMRAVEHIIERPLPELPRRGQCGR
jgi:hypothetical protein